MWCSKLFVVTDKPGASPCPQPTGKHQLMSQETVYNNVVSSRETSTNHHSSMKQSFKVVTVYTGYAEYGVEGIEVIHADNISEAAVLAEENIQEALREDGVDEHHIAEFYTGVRQLSSKLYMVNNGEENVLLVIAESHALYAQVDQPINEWTNHQWEDWVKVLESDVVTA